MNIIKKSILTIRGTLTVCIITTLESVADISIRFEQEVASISRPTGVTRTQACH